MTTGELAGLRVRSDLHLLVDGVSAELVADGRQLTLRTDDAAGLITAALGSRPPGRGSTSWRSALDRVAVGLDAAGLSARVEGEHGTLLELGAGATSRPARLLLGTDRARFGPIRILGATAIDWLRTTVSRRRSRREQETHHDPR